MWVLGRVQILPVQRVPELKASQAIEHQNLDTTGFDPISNQAGQPKAMVVVFPEPATASTRP